MKLKFFDLYDMLEQAGTERLEIISKEVAPHCLYISRELGICLLEQKPAIVAIVQKHAVELGLKMRVQGNFVNLDSQLVGQNVDWEPIWIDEFNMIDSEPFWKEVVKILKEREEYLIQDNNFASEWASIKKEGLRNAILAKYEEEKADLERGLKFLLDKWMKLEKVPLF